MGQPKQSKKPYNTGVNPGFFLGGGAPPRNGKTDW